MKSLAMKNFTMIRVSPNRLNIRLCCIKLSKYDPSVLSWVVDGLKAERNTFPKTIIYCQSIEKVFEVFVLLKDELCKYAYLKEDEGLDDLLIGMFHRKTLEKHKQRIINDLSVPDGSCRVVVATTSLGMGVDIRDLRYIIHYRSPRNIEEFIQGMGRAGRDNKESSSILFFTWRQHANASQEIKTFTNAGNQCLRTALYGNYTTSQIKRPDLKHLCCSFCHKSCLCEEDRTCRTSTQVYEEENSEALFKEIRQASKGEKELFYGVLLDYKSRVEKATENCHLFTNMEYITG